MDQAAQVLEGEVIKVVEAAGMTFQYVRLDGQVVMLVQGMNDSFALLEA